jgi:hypothetical protein
MNRTAQSNKAQTLQWNFVASLVSCLALTVAGTSASFALAQPSAQVQPPVSVLANPAPAKPTTSIPLAKAPAANLATTKLEAKPKWQELTPEQQQSLKPLAANWASIGEAQKRKWLALSKNYPALPPAEQAKLRGRMTEWVALSQQERTQARLNFAETKKLSPTEKAATWQAYQALSPEEKQKLAAKAVPKPTGAAAAVKPVAPQKLAVGPVPRHGAKHSQEVVSSTRSVDTNTLLPRPPASGELAPVQKH